MTSTKNRPNQCFPRKHHWPTFTEKIELTLAKIVLADVGQKKSYPTLTQAGVSKKNHWLTLIRWNQSWHPPKRIIDDKKKIASIDHQIPPTNVSLKTSLVDVGIKTVVFFADMANVFFHQRRPIILFFVDGVSWPTSTKAFVFGRHRLGFIPPTMTRIFYGWHLSRLFFGWSRLEIF